LLPFALELLAASMAVAADLSVEAPASDFNLPGQARTRTCVPMKSTKVVLRFSDGTPTGWFVSGDDPSRQGGNHQACPRSTMELDVHEMVTTANGMKLYFHPGGGPGHYRDCVEDGQYGHVAEEDLVSPPNPVGDINGKPAPLSGVRYFITPTRIPPDMWYKPNVSNGHSGSTYYTYGNPGYDKTGGRGDWTYLNWSWVQNGGATYPANKCGGGGMVRALAKRDSDFNACSVKAIIGYSYGADNAVNGRVTALYGRMFAGPEEKGHAIYGWTAHSYQKNGESIVPCLRRAEVDALPTASPASRKDRAERMAWNLLHPTKPDATTRQALIRKYAEESDPRARMELITELSRIDDAQTVAALLGILSEEADPRVREQAIAIVGFLASAAREMNRIAPALAENYRRADQSERLRTLDVISNYPAAAVVRVVTSVWNAPASEVERLAAMDAILKLAPRVAMDEAIVRSAKELRARMTASRAVPADRPAEE
jgi:hypothetical protein